MMKGMGPITETEVNERGGKQSKIPYRFDLLDAKAMARVAEILYDGANKYGDNNWRLLDVNTNVNHALAHLFAYLSGDQMDDHLGHAACRIMFALGIHLQEELEE